MYRAFAQSSPELSVSATDSPFVYISAEDIFRPFIPARYIQTKRETERIIADEVTLARISDEAAGKREIRPVFIRPSEGLRIRFSFVQISLTVSSSQASSTILT